MRKQTLFCFFQALSIFANLDIFQEQSSREAVPPTRNVNLTGELDRFVLEKVESGRYENASEVVRAALRTPGARRPAIRAKLTALRAAIDEGDASGIVEGDAFTRVRQTLKLPKKRR